MELTGLNAEARKMTTNTELTELFYAFGPIFLAALLFLAVLIHIVTRHRG
jgi:hypothetical protein